MSASSKNLTFEDQPANNLKKKKKLLTEQDGGGVGGSGYIKNTPSDTEVHAEHQLRADSST